MKAALLDLKYSKNSNIMMKAALLDLKYSKNSNIMTKAALFDQKFSNMLSSLALNGGGRIFHSPSSLIFPACSPVLSDLLRDSLCTALQTEKLWIWSTGLSTLLTPSWRYLPIRNHDNRYFADWIRLCPGLSKNSEDGNSCPKPHKAARHDWSSGKSGQHWDWDY